MNSIPSRRVVHQFLPLLLFFISGSSFAKQKTTAESDLKRLYAVVRGLEARLQMPQHVDVTILPVELRMVSVQRLREVDGGERFMISVDQEFFNSLSHEELKAAMAHELGHVWIYSHHPYLQTEALANEIAMRAVSRESMKKIYAKLWVHLGTTGDLDQLLGSEKKTAEHSRNVRMAP
jgi:hypothetical protein